MFRVKVIGGPSQDFVLVLEEILLHKKVKSKIFVHGLMQNAQYKAITVSAEFVTQIWHKKSQ